MGEAVTSAQLAACPFTPCEARPQLHYQRAQDEFGRASNHALISMHAVGGGEWFGTCPASLMAHPIMPHERGILDDFTGTFLAMAASREKAHVETADRISSSLRDQGWRKARWFRNSEGEPSGGVNARESRLRLVTDNDKEGGAVASISEVRAALMAANQAIAEAQSANLATLQKLADAKVAVLAARGTAQEDLSIPVIDAATESAEIISQLTHTAIEINSEYGARL